MERFMWESYPAHVKATLFHAELLEPWRKKSLSERMTQALAYKAAGERQFASGDFRAAQASPNPNPHPHPDPNPKNTKTKTSLKSGMIG